MSDELSETASVATKSIKFRNRGEAEHWSRVQASQLHSFNFWSKRKVNEDLAIRLCSERADKALLEMRKRAERNGK